MPAKLRVLAPAQPSPCACAARADQLRVRLSKTRMRDLKVETPIPFWTDDGSSLSSVVFNYQPISTAEKPSDKTTKSTANPINLKWPLKEKCEYEISLIVPGIQYVAQSKHDKNRLHPQVLAHSDCV